MPPRPRENRSSDNRLRDAEPAPERTPIWVAGTQQPKFNLRAWAAVGVALSRRWVAPWLDWTAAALTRLGDTVTAGRYRVNTAWMRQASRIVPSYQTVGAIVTGTGTRIAEARAILMPTPTAPEPIAYPNLIRTEATLRPDATLRIVSPIMPALDRQPTVKLSAVPPSAEPPTATQPTSAPRPPKLTTVEPTLTTPEPTKVEPTPIEPTLSEPTLSAIRALINEDTAPAQAKRHTATALPQPDAPDVPQDATPAKPPRLIWLRPRLARATAHVIAWSVLALSLPVGLVQATLYHLNGGDLADWE